jgi:hypothetical protein
MWFPSSLSVNTIYDLSRTSFFFPFSFLRCYHSIEARYLFINYICKLEYYYVVQVYWELAVSGVANWRQSACFVDYDFIPTRSSTPPSPARSLQVCL